MTWRLLAPGGVEYSLGLARSHRLCVVCNHVAHDVVAWDVGGRSGAYCVPCRRAHVGLTSEEREESKARQLGLLR